MKNVKGITYAALKMAKNKGNSQEDAEDFAQFCLIQYSVNRKATMDNIFTDWMRTLYGRPEGKTNKLRLQELRYYKSVDDSAFSIKQTPTYSEFKSLMTLLAGDERAIAIMYYEFEYTLLEIAHFYGVAECRMSQRLTEIREKLRNAIR